MKRAPGLFMEEASVTRMCLRVQFSGKNYASYIRGWGQEVFHAACLPYQRVAV